MLSQRSKTWIGLTGIIALMIQMVLAAAHVHDLRVALDNEHAGPSISQSQSRTDGTADLHRRSLVHGAHFDGAHGPDSHSVGHVGSEHQHHSDENHDERRDHGHTPEACDFCMLLAALATLLLPLLLLLWSCKIDKTFQLVRASLTLTPPPAFAHHARAPPLLASN